MEPDERDRLLALFTSMTTVQLRTYRDALALDRDRAAAAKDLENLRFCDERIALLYTVLKTRPTL